MPDIIETQAFRIIGPNVNKFLGAYNILLISIDTIQASVLAILLENNNCNF